jgi:uncharacterized membrane protein YtjA (UPF0391 family)
VGYWAAVVALMAAIGWVLDYGGLAATSGPAAVALFFVFLAVFLVALVGAVRRQRPPSG